MLESLFEIRAASERSTRLSSEKTMEKKRKRPKRTPEVEAAMERYGRDLDQRLIAMIEKYRERIEARKRAEGV